MKIKHTKLSYTSDEKVITMNTVEVQYEERNVNLDEVRKIAKHSSMRIQKDRDEQLDKAIKNHDTFYIRRELSNVSSYELTKMLIEKAIQRLQKNK